MSKNLPIDWSANFSMDGEREKSRMKAVANELASLISSLDLGSEELLPIEKYVQLAGQKIVDAKYNMDGLVNLAWGRKIRLGLDLNEEPMAKNYVDDELTPLISFLKPMSMPNHCEIL